jgi:RNA polymerase sigma factor (sigma-70 family)
MTDHQGGRRPGLTAAEADRVGEVFTQHRRFVEAVARQHAIGPDHVPDIVQTVALQMCRSLNGYRGDAAITTWLYRLTVNAARDHYQREVRQVRVAERLLRLPDPEPVLDLDEQADQSRRLVALQVAVNRLKPQHRRLMREELHGSAVLSDRKSSRHRARQQLRRLMTEESD